MKAGDYKLLCSLTDEILLDENAGPGRIAIPWLHVIREHPIFLKNYQHLFESPESALSALTRSILPVVKNLAGIRRYLREKGSYWAASEPDLTPCDIVIVSHLLNEENAGKNADSYFADLPSELSSLGYKVKVVLLNHSRLSTSAAAGKWTGSAVPRIVLSPILKLKEEIELTLQLKKESDLLRKEAESEPGWLKKRILRQASREALSNSSTQVFRMSGQFEKLVDQLQPRMIISTYEGHAWERILFHAARKIRPEIICTAYQHAAVFQLQHAIRRNLAGKFNPDVILAAGPVSKSQFEKSPLIKNIPVHILGSNRGAGNGVRPAASPDGDPNAITCIVLPEGLWDECYALFEFSLRCALRYPDVKFIWRLHPMLNFKDLVAKYSAFKALPDNIELSSRPLQGDMNVSTCALYRGTTAIVQAVCSGLRPLYLQIPGELSIDPLYEVEKWKALIRTEEDFAASSGIGNGRDETTITDKEEVINYCLEFYSPINVAVLDKLIKQNC